MIVSLKNELKASKLKNSTPPSFGNRTTACGSLGRDLRFG